MPQVIETITENDLAPAFAAAAALYFGKDGLRIQRTKGGKGLYATTPAPSGQPPRAILTAAQEGDTTIIAFQGSGMTPEKLDTLRGQLAHVSGITTCARSPDKIFVEGDLTFETLGAVVRSWHAALTQEI